MHLGPPRTVLPYYYTITDKWMFRNMALVLGAIRSGIVVITKTPYCRPLR